MIKCVQLNGVGYFGVNITKLGSGPDKVKYIQFKGGVNDVLYLYDDDVSIEIQALKMRTKVGKRKN